MDVAGGGAEVRATVTITRAATGAVETYEIVGKVTDEQLQELIDKGDCDDDGNA